jgi:deazaflavin-dependent oxidoreductase (nitroreductase family)
VTNEQLERPHLPPRWFVRTFWRAHRAVYRLAGGRLGLWRPKPDRWGTLRLTTIGRRSGRERGVIVAYIEDGPDLVLLAMNGWADGEPAWWLNLRAQPDAAVELGHEHRRVRAHRATGPERARLWARWREVGSKLDEHAALRSTETTVVVLQPAPRASDR